MTRALNLPRAARVRATAEGVPVEVDGRSLRLSPEVPRLAERYGYSMDSSQAKKLT